MIKTTLFRVSAAERPKRHQLLRTRELFVRATSFNEAVEVARDSLAEQDFRLCTALVFEICEPDSGVGLVYEPTQPGIAFMVVREKVTRIRS